MGPLMSAREPVPFTRRLVESLGETAQP
jgi:hypothetical protein